MHLKRLAGMLGALGNGVETDMSSDDEARIVSSDLESRSHLFMRIGR